MLQNLGKSLPKYPMQNDGFCILHNSPVHAVLVHDGGLDTPGGLGEGIALVKYESR